MNPAFSARALREFEPYMNAEPREWKLQFLSMTLSGNAIVDFSVWIKENYLAFDVIGSSSFGKPFGFIKKGDDTYGLIQTIDERGEVLNALGSTPSWLRSLMKYHPFDPFWKRGVNAKASLEDFGRRAYFERKYSTRCDRRDLLSYLLAAKDPDTGNPLPEEEIIAESISFIVGGSDTISSTMTNFIDHVSRDKTLLSVFTRNSM